MAFVLCNRTETTTTETAAHNIHRGADHVVIENYD
jgi:hypothetical protein